MRRALVIGGSLGGLFAGCLLHKAGWEVAVYERAMGDLTGRGAGLGVSREFLEMMRRVGAKFDASSGVSQREHVWMARSGEIVFRHRRNLMASAWARIYQPLRAALPGGIYRQGMALARLEQDDVVAPARRRPRAPEPCGAAADDHDRRHGRSAMTRATSAPQKNPWQRPISARVRRRSPSRSTGGIGLRSASRTSPRETPNSTNSSVP
jgi:glycine/D-amino acid oxidase-like deaminating enzyme